MGRPAPRLDAQRRGVACGVVGCDRNRVGSGCRCRAPVVLLAECRTRGIGLRVGMVNHCASWCSMYLNLRNPALLSTNPVAGDYATSVRDDIRDASVVRFAIAFVTRAGLEVIGPDLAPALRHPDSFGVASLTCQSFLPDDDTPSLPPLVELAARVGPEGPSRLKYFFEPMPQDAGRAGGDDDEVDDVRLLHSKLLFIQTSDGRSITYVGSHNWSLRALGDAHAASKPSRGDCYRNAEVGLRVVERLERSPLDGVGDSVAAQANRHLLACWRLPATYPADARDLDRYHQWRRLACPIQDDPIPKVLARVILATLPEGSIDSDSGTAHWPRWAELVGKGVYIQALREEEGNDELWKADGPVLMLVWPYPSAPLDAANGVRPTPSPVILRGLLSTINSSQGSDRVGNNRSPQPLEGFAGMAWSPLHLATARQLEAQRGAGHYTDRLLSRAAYPGDGFRFVELPTGTKLQMYDFRFTDHPSERTTRAVDMGVEVKYQALFEVTEVVVPHRTLGESDAQRVDALAKIGQKVGVLAMPEHALAFDYVSTSQSLSTERPEGYADPNANKTMSSLISVFGSGITKSKALPVRDDRNHLRPRYVVDHGLNDALGPVGPGQDHHIPRPLGIAPDVLEHALRMPVAASLLATADGGGRPRQRVGRARRPMGPILAVRHQVWQDLTRSWMAVWMVLLADLGLAPVLDARWKDLHGRKD